MSELSGVEKTLNERGTNYGEFENFSSIVRALKQIMFIETRSNLEDFHMEALDMIFHKIARILNGNPNYADSWHDIAGYATLVEQIINRRKNE